MKNNSKKAISLFLCATMILAGCSNNTVAETEETTATTTTLIKSTETIPLTRNNIESYLHIIEDMSDGVTCENTNSYYGAGVAKIEVKPCSNAKFENVTIELKLALNPYTAGGVWQFERGGYYTTSWENSTEKVHVKDVSMAISYDGNGLIEEDVNLNLSKIAWYKDTEEWNIFGMPPSDCFLYYEIVNITGNVIVEK